MAIPPTGTRAQLESGGDPDPYGGVLRPDGPRLQPRRRNSPRGNPSGAGTRGNFHGGHNGRRSGADRGLVRYRYPVDVANLRNPAFRRPESFVRCGVFGGSAGSRSHAGRILRFPASPVALGRVGIRLEYRHRYVVLRRNTRPVHTQSCLLLENRTGDAGWGERLV